MKAPPMVYRAVHDTDHGLDHGQTVSRGHLEVVDAKTRAVAHLDRLVFDRDAVHDEHDDEEVENESHWETRGICVVTGPWNPLSLYSLL